MFENQVTQQELHKHVFDCCVMEIFEIFLQLIGI